VIQNKFVQDKDLFPKREISFCLKMATQEKGNKLVQNRDYFEKKKIIIIRVCLQMTNVLPVWTDYPKERRNQYRIKMIKKYMYASTFR